MFTRFFDLSCAQWATRAHLYESLGLWMRHVAEDKLQVYVERLGVLQVYVGVEQFRGQRDGHALLPCQALLRGLAQAMALPNPPKHCWSLLCSVTEKIYSILPDRVQVDPQLSNTKLSMLFFYSANVRLKHFVRPHVAPRPQIGHLCSGLTASILLHVGSAFRTAEVWPDSVT